MRYGLFSHKKNGGTQREKLRASASLWPIFEKMKIEFWAIGKTERGWVEDGAAVYASRLKKYGAFEAVVLPDVREKSLEPELLKRREGEAILKRLEPTDFLVLLDERGAEFSSRAFAEWIEKLQISGPKRLIFLVGGAFGFSAEVYSRANFQLSLSKMTMPHQMIRIVFLEQLFRAFSILKNEPYHND